MNLSTFWNQHGAHALSYVGSALLIVCGFAGTYGGLVPKYGPIIMGAAGLTATFVHQLQQLAKGSATLPAPAPSAVSKQSGRALFTLLGVLCAVSLCAMILISACATIQKVMSNPASASAVEAAIDVGVGTYIQATAKTPADQAAKAAQISAIASALEGVLTGDQATLAQLDQVLQAKIAAAHLPPADQAAAVILTQTVQSIVLQEIQGGPAAGKAPALTSDQVVAVKAVLDDLIQAASFYGVHARAVVRAQLAR